MNLSPMTPAPSSDPLFLNIIVPAYNEEQNISETIRTISEIQSLITIPHKLIVVNDNSTDRTQEVVEALRRRYDNLVLINRRGNHGLGRCLDRAYEEVERGVVVAVMADLADDVNDIPRMLDKIREGYDLVSASRYIPRGSGEHLNPLKHSLSRLLGKALQMLIGLPTNDATNAYKMYRADVLDKIGILKSDNYTTGLEITVKAYLQGLKIAEVPTVWKDRSRGQSHFKIVKVAPEYIRWFLWAVWNGWKYRNKGIWE
ncbi:MAG: glycosyltransferase [Candidatus Aureabacteria bacterium]|nr:glycosyltransferase [Candidatus Auribacterota bacterium]